MNGNSGFEVFPNCSNADERAQIYILNNTSYGNAQDPRRTDPGAELFINQVMPTAASGAVYKIERNSFVATEATTGNNAKAPVYAAAVYVNNRNIGLVSINDNYFWQSIPGTLGEAGNPNTDVFISGAHDRNSFPFGANIYADPGFANPGGLPTIAPDCSGYADTTRCMNGRFHVAANLTPNAAAVGHGYQPPGQCAPDPFYPTWLKGVVYLHWDEFNWSENTGLITKPCGM